VTTTLSCEREACCEQTLQQWSMRTGIDLTRIDSGQRWVIFAALQAVTLLGETQALKRVVVFLLANCGMGLPATVIASVVGTSDRTIRNLRSYSSAQLLTSVRQRLGGNHKPKLKAEHAGVVGKLLLLHPDARVKELIELIEEEIGIKVDRLTLRRFLKKYGLGCLRGELITNRPPLLPKPLLGEAFS